MLTTSLLCVLLTVTTLEEPSSFNTAADLDSVPPTTEGPRVTMPSIEARGSFLAGAPSASPMSGSWQLSWDDQIDGQLDESPKRCDLKLRCVDNQLGGEFIGPVTGRTRDAIISGQRVESSEGALLILKQSEPGYQCSYQIFLGNTNRTKAPYGVWHDSTGRSGEFGLLKYQ